MSDEKDRGTDSLIPSAIGELVVKSTSLRLLDEQKPAEAEFVSGLRERTNAGEAEAKICLWFCLEHGVPQDDVQALAWFREIAEMEGASLLQHELGHMYSEGRCVPQDDRQAVEWYRKAAEHGDPPAQDSLGRMYAAGRGVPQDYVQAHKWCNLAATLASEDQWYSRGQKEYKDARDAVARSMAPQQLAEARELARDWMEAFNGRQP